LAIETFASRATSSSGSPPKSRGTIPILPLTEKRLGLFPSTPEGTPTPALGERSGAPSDLRPSSFFMGNTPVEVQFTSAGCLNYPCRTPTGQDQLTDDRLALVSGGSIGVTQTVSSPKPQEMPFKLLAEF